jgi:hypothetical protein
MTRRDYILYVLLPLVTGTVSVVIANCIVHIIVLPKFLN